jgi:thiamine-phosphate diphosphorylase
MSFMHWRKKRLLNSKLYLILDREVNTYPELMDIARRATAAGIDIMQLRDKKGSARNILEFSQKALKIIKGRSLYIINDRVDLALLSGSDGVHLGQDDVSIDSARKILNKDQLVGVSCQTPVHIKKAVRDGADYLGFGSIYKTKTKPDRHPMNKKYLLSVLKSDVPVFAIGGISLKNIDELTSLGIRRVAVCRAICESNNIEKSVKDFQAKLG